MNYQAKRTIPDGFETIELSDAAREASLAIVPGIGNMAYRWCVRGTELLWFPFDSLRAFAEKPALCGVPLLAPWANRLDGDGYWANGRRYLLNPELGNIRRDANQKPIHGLLNFSHLWQPVEAASDAQSAWAVSRLEFARHPALMAQFPFAHTLTMTHRLKDGALEVETQIENHSSDAMPVALGYHPYFRLLAPREQCRVHLAAREHLLLNSLVMPTGEHEPVRFADPHPLSAGPLDDVFTGLICDSDGRARFWVEGGGHRLTVEYGPKYTVAVVYAPEGKDFICFEPMAAVTNAFNLAHDGKYAGLQCIPPGAEWRETFRILYE